MILTGPTPCTIGAFCVCQTNGPSPGPTHQSPGAPAVLSLWSNLNRHHYKLTINSRSETPSLPLSQDKWPFPCTLPHRPSPGCLLPLGRGGEPTELLGKPSSFSNPSNLARRGQQTVPTAQSGGDTQSFPQSALGFLRPAWKLLLFLPQLCELKKSYSVLVNRS